MNHLSSKTIFGPLVALGTLGLTLAVFYYFFAAGAPLQLNSTSLAPTATAPATATATPSPTPTPDISPQTVDLTAADGTGLKATFYPPNNSEPDNPTLLLLHMAYSNRKVWRDFALTAQQAGYALLSLDLRGHGDSSGEKTFTPVMDDDVTAALNWLNARPNIDSSRIGIAGASLGASLALRGAAVNPDIKSVALLSPGLGLWDIKIDDAMVQYGPRPALIIVSEDDGYPASSSKKLDEQAVGEHQLIVYPGDVHGTDLFKTEPDLQVTLLDWFNRTLSHIPAAKANVSSQPPVISAISAGLSSNAAGQTPRQYEMVELTFEVETAAKNLQLPYDASPPPGIEPEIGISVDALFTPDNWQTVYRQPAFYYQQFEHVTKGDNDWIYPTDQFVWKVRFSPTQTGTWQFKLTARDSGGATETGPQTFQVEPSDKKGFVRVSQRDPRYFEFDNGDLFTGLGYNLTFGQLNWVNPVAANEPRFQELQENGLQLFRTWLSHWGIFTSAWNPWNALASDLHTQYIPFPGLTFEESTPQSEVSLRVNAARNPCMFIGAWKAKPAVRQNRTYRVRILYKTKGIEGPRVSGQPYGFVAKTGGWLASEESNCDDPDIGQPVTSHRPQNSGDWQILEGEIDSGDNDFLPNFYLVMDNVTAGQAFVDYVWIEERLDGGGYGPNIVSKPWMDQHRYFEQRNSYAFDKVLELAEKYDIYLKLVLLEKNERLLNRIDFDGNPVPGDPLCWDDDKSNDPEKCPGNRWFYGNYQETTKVRWLQQAWWRYAQARWGYSPHIHSWELLNEGDPFNGTHYALAEAFGQYMHQFTPNDHLVTTSFWHSFPADQFWANPDYPHVDYADLHAYSPDSLDTAGDSIFYSEKHGAHQPEGAVKPLMRGETGFSDEVLEDSEGIWLHNYIWAGINAGGMYEQYWHSGKHIIQPKQGNDLRYHFRAFRNFIDGIPLNNGNYQPLEPAITGEELRVTGQKDLERGCAHLWAQNKAHTWRNVVDDETIKSVSASITLPGFQPDASYTLEQWDPYQPELAQQITSTGTLTAQPDGALVVQIDDLTSDIALKIAASDQCSKQ